MIFTDRTITVRKGESRIDEPIVVYRGDYELEVRFTILNSRFKFKSGVNMIESEKASYGQLAILTPYGGNIFSNIVRCDDGSVTFVLTADMLNQIEEVGLYSFQIRLMDYNKESRVSIPPIVFGIEVREPIASEDHDNRVNNAIVGYSIAKVVDPKEENVGDTFDGSGNYNKTKWETGDRISEGKLNKIEDAIDKINQNEIDDKNTLNKQMTSNFNVLQNQINDLIIESGNTDAEVVQARGEYNLLNQRLNAMDETDTELTSQLMNIKKKILCVNIEDFGAKGDGTTDNTEAIKNAIKFLSENGGGTIKIPVGVFCSGPFSMVDNLTIEGVGHESCLKVKNNIGDFYSFISMSNCNSVTIRNLSIDVNKDGNGGKIFTNGIAGVKAQILIYIKNTINAIIENCNMIACGVWAITMDATNVKPKNENIIIRDNIIIWSEGNSDPQPDLNGNTTYITYDNTMIFAEATNFLISNNTFICTDSRGQTALETHTGYGVAENNYIENFNSGILIVANHWDVDDNDEYLYDRDTSLVIKGNIIKKSLNGIILWPLPNRELRDVIIDGNMIELNSTKQKRVASRGIGTLFTLSTDSKAHRNISILNNTIKYLEDTTIYTDTDHNLNFTGISIGFNNPTYNLMINNNTIIKAPSSGIAVISYNNEVKGVTINGNTIIDAGANPNLSTAYYNPKCAIRVGDGVKNVCIGENTIIDTSDTLKLTRLYYLNGESANGYRSPIIKVADTTFPADDVRIEFTPKIAFDSQVGTITTNITSAWYTRNGNRFRIYMDIYTTDIAITTGYAAYIKVPFSFQEVQYKPIVWEENIQDTMARSIICRTNGNTNLFYILTNIAGGTFNSITSKAFVENSRLIIDFEVDLKFITCELESFFKTY